MIPFVIGAVGKGAVRVVNPRTNRDHSNYCTVKIGLNPEKNPGDHPNGSIIQISQNTKKSPGDARRLVVT